MKLRPLHDRVIVKRLEQETKTASGIVIPDNAAEKPDQGEVLAVGPGKRNDKGDFVALNVVVGDRVLFGKYSGQTVKVDGDELLVMREEDLFAVVQNQVSPDAWLWLAPTEYVPRQAWLTRIRLGASAQGNPLLNSEKYTWQLKTSSSVPTPVTAWSKA
jgi:chaperonin GroES